MGPSRTLPEPAYAVGRVVALLTRPLCLFTANNYLGGTTAEGLALTFLASGLGMAAIAADPHRAFYARRFAAAPVPAPHTYFVYLTNVTLLSILGCFIVAAVTVRFAGAQALVPLAILYFISEKIADEVLRLRLFERDFRGWGRSAFARSALQGIGIGGLVLLFPSAPAPVIVATLTAATLAIFVPQLPLHVALVKRLLMPFTLRRLMTRSLRSLRMNWIFWAISLFGTTVGYLDRLVAVVLAPAQLPIFTMIVMAFSIVPTAVDFFFLSLHRTDLLRQTMSVRDVLWNRRFLISVAGSLAIGALASVLILAIAVGSSTFPVWYVPIIAIVQTSMALSSTPQQILYWSRRFTSIIYTEAGFWLVVAAGVATVAMSEVSTDAMFLVVGFCPLLRLAAYVWQADRVLPHPRPEARLA